MSLEKVEVKSGIIEQLAKAKLNSYTFEADETVALPFLKSELEGGFHDLNTEEVKKARYQYFEIPEATEDDYGEFIFRTSDGEYLMAGIRHFSGNKDIPFVHVISSLSNPPLETLREWGKELVEIFAIFKPLFLSTGFPEKVDVDFIASVTMAAKAETYRLLPNMDNEDRLTIKQETNLEIYDWYIDGYRRFHLQYPELKEKVPTCEREVLEDSLKEGLLYTAYYDEELVGLIAAQSGYFLGLDGLYFNEIFLLEKVKGLGLGKALQKKFVLEVTKGHEIIWGTIDESNTPSFKTAAANGRKPVHYEGFLNLKQNS